MPKAEKKYAKTRGEHVKDIIIAVLVASIVAFIAGANYQSAKQHEVDSAVHNAVANQSTAKAPEKK